VGVPGFGEQGGDFQFEGLHRLAGVRVTHGRVLARAGQVFVPSIATVTPPTLSTPQRVASSKTCAKACFKQRAALPTNPQCRRRRLIGLPLRRCVNYPRPKRDLPGRRSSTVHCSRRIPFASVKTHQQTCS